MPLVRIEIIDGKTKEYKAQLMEGIHQALVRSLQIDDGDRFQRLYEISSEDFERNPGKSDRFTMIEITMFKGRSREQKAKLYEEIVSELGRRLSIEATDIFIVINEPDDENWGLAGKMRCG